MSQSEQEQFWTLVEGFIGQANAATEEVDIGIVHSALMEATARFGAYFTAANSESRKDLAEDIDPTVTAFGSEYKRKLAENLNDYHEHYKVYLREED